MNLIYLISRYVYLRIRFNIFVPTYKMKHDNKIISKCVKFEEAL